MDKQTFLDMAFQSDAAFRQQFDPNSPNFHGGSSVAVPLNGSRIPETMQSMFPQNYDPNKQEDVIDYGEEFNKIESQRQIYLELKKLLAKLGPIVESFLRHQNHLKQKGDVTNESHVKIYNQNVKKENENLDKVIKEIQDYLPKLDDLSEEGKQFGKQLKKVMEDSKKKYENKEELTNYNFNVKKLSTKIFSQSNKCLQALKDIKKQYKNPAKEQNDKNE